MKENQILYTFNFLGGGFNQVWADTKKEALVIAKRSFPGWADQIDPKSFRRLASKKAQAAYWASFPLMD